MMNKSEHNVPGAQRVNEQHHGEAALVALRSKLEFGLACSGLKVSGLARRARLGRTTVHAALQAGGPVPSPNTVAALGRALSLPVDELLELRRAALAPTRTDGYDAHISEDPGPGTWEASPTLSGRAMLHALRQHPDRLAVLLPPIQSHQADVQAMAFSPDGALLATAGTDGSIKLWNVVTGQQLGSPLLGHRGFVNSLAFSPDGSQLATGGEDATVRLWRLAPRPTTLHVLDADRWRIDTVTFSPDGTLLATCGVEGKIRLWDPASGRQTGTLVDHGNFVNALTFSPDSRLVATAGRDGTVRLWNPASGTQVGASSTAGPIEVFFTSPTEGLTVTEGGTVQRWRAGAELHSFDIFTDRSDPHWPVCTAALSPGGNLCAIVREAGPVQLWNVASGRPVGRPLRDHAAHIWSAAFSPDGTLLATAGEGGEILLRVIAH